MLEDVIQVTHCSIDEQLADILTKPLRREKFCYFRKLLGVIDQ